MQGQQQALQGYSNLANGVGPNPAMAQLAQTTGQNIASQAALQAGQRGASSNVGLMARQAGQQGAAIQQNAVGQAATLGSQQQLAGLQGMAGQANTMTANEIGQTNANTQAQLAAQSNLLNAQAGVNQANVGMQSNINQGNTALALQSMQQGESAVGGFFGGAGSATSMIGGSAAAAAAGGGVVRKMADGGSAFSGAQSEFGQFIVGGGGGGGGSINTGNYVSPNSVMQPGSSSGSAKKQKPKGQNPQAMNQPQGQKPADYDPETNSSDQMADYNAKGGMVDVVLSPGEKVVSPKNAKKAAQGGELKAKTVPGKAKVPGDDYANDIVRTELPPGSVVVKRTRANNDPKGFVRDVLAKRGRK